MAKVAAEQVDAVARLLQEAREEEAEEQVRAQVERIDALVDSFHEATLTWISTLEDGKKPTAGSCEEELFIDSGDKICDLENDISFEIDHLRDHINELGRSGEISTERRLMFEMQASNLYDRYIDCCEIDPEDIHLLEALHCRFISIC